MIEIQKRTACDCSISHYATGATTEEDRNEFCGMSEQTIAIQLGWAYIIAEGHMLTKLQRQELDKEIDYMTRQDDRWKTLNKKQTFWQRYNDDIGFLLWCVVGVMIGAGIFWVYGIWPR